MKPTPRPWLVLALVCLPVFIGALDLTVISAVLPAVISDLNIAVQSGLDQAAWVVSGYLLAYAISMTFMGRVSDLQGRRKVYLACLAIFFVGSWLVAASAGLPAQVAERIARLLAGGRPDRSLMALDALIFGRVVQAFGAGAMVPVTMALVGDLFPPERRSIPLGVVGGVDTAGWVLGHLYGGIMVQFFPWSYLFWVNLPISALFFGLTAWALRGVQAPQAVGRLDWPGAALIGWALLSLNLGLGATDAGALALKGGAMWLALGLAGLIAFIWIERRTTHPLLNLALFKDRHLSAAAGLNLLVGFSLMVGLVSVPLYINLAGARDSGQAALVSGYLLSTFTVPMALAAVAGGWLAERAGHRRTAVLGLLLALVGFILMSLWRTEFARLAVEFFETLGEAPGPSAESAAGVVGMARGLLLAGIGLGLTIAPIGTTVINSVGESERGMASSLVIILRLIGMSLSVSVLTAYGLRRSTILSRTLLEGVALTEFERLAETALQVATQVTAEMAVIASAVCIGALMPAALLRRQPAFHKPALDMQTGQRVE